MMQKTCGAQQIINKSAEPTSILARCLRERNVEFCSSGMPGVATRLTTRPGRAVRCLCECSRISRIALEFHFNSLLL